MQENAKSWKEAAEALAVELAEVTQERDEMQSRLDEIAALAAPEEDPERLARVEAKLDALLKDAAVAYRPHAVDADFEPTGDHPE